MKIKAVERELIEAGWQKAYRSPGEKEQAAPQGKGTLAALEIGQCVRPKKVRAEKRSGLDEAGLIRMLREKGIGRPATYALIVDALLTRKYAEREPGGQLRLTKRGQEVCEFLEKSFPSLFNLGYTAEMENELDQIAGGELAYDAVVKNILGILDKK